MKRPWGSRAQQRVLSENEKVLYVATSGANVMPVDGKTEPAKIVQVKLH
jgi:hypothetical protein